MKLYKLAIVFLRMGCLSFGGFGSFLAVAKHELVEHRCVLKDSDIAEAITYVNLLPGPTTVQMVAFLGLRLGGISGAILSVVAFVLPSFCIMIILSLLFSRLASLPGLQGAMRGLNSAVVGLLTVACYRMAQSTLKSRLAAVLALTALILSLAINLPIAFTIIGAGLAQIVADVRHK